MADDRDSLIEDQITTWRAYVSRREAIDVCHGPQGYKGGLGALLAGLRV